MIKPKQKLSAKVSQNFKLNPNFYNVIGLHDSIAIQCIFQLIWRWQMKLEILSHDAIEKPYTERPMHDAIFSMVWV